MSNFVTGEVSDWQFVMLEDYGLYYHPKKP